MFLPASVPSTPSPPAKFILFPPSQGDPCVLPWALLFTSPSPVRGSRKERPGQGDLSQHWGNPESWVWENIEWRRTTSSLPGLAAGMACDWVGSSCPICWLEHPRKWGRRQEGGGEWSCSGSHGLQLRTISKICCPGEQMLHLPFENHVSWLCLLFAFIYFCILS